MIAEHTTTVKPHRRRPVPSWIGAEARGNMDRVLALAACLDEYIAAADAPLQSRRLQDGKPGRPVQYVTSARPDSNPRARRVDIENGLRQINRLLLEILQPVDP